MKFRYYYTEGEANFGKPLRTEVSGGAHLTFDVVLHQGATVYALRLPDGLHDGPKNALYFPHGLIRFGESVPDCVARLARDQAHVGVRAIRLYTFPSWVDDNEHWHLCLNVLADIDEPPTPSDGISEVVPVTESIIPTDFAWWTEAQMGDLLLLLKSLARVEPPAPNRLPLDSD